VRDAHGLERLDHRGGRVICLNGHDWGEIGRGEDLQEWYEERVRAYRGRCLK
jgi:hypothetical protein